MFDSRPTSEQADQADVNDDANETPADKQVPAQMLSFDKLCIPLRHELVNYAARLLGRCRSMLGAEDIAQHAMLKAWRAWPTFRPGDMTTVEHYVRGWLYRIVLNTYLNVWKQEKQMSSICEQHVTDLVDRLGASVAGEGIRGAVAHHAYQNPAEQVLGDEVTLALAALGPEYREIVSLMAEEPELSSIDIARRLRVPVGTVHSRLNRARTAMQKRLRAYAATEYGIGCDDSGRADEDPVEPIERPRAHAGGIQSVVR